MMVEDEIRGRCSWRVRVALAVALLVLIFFPARTQAHRVTVFAWVEADTVYVEGKFPDGKPVKQGEIMVYDLEGDMLLSGKTDEKGKFSFKVPQKTGMKVELRAGAGHRAEWKITAAEVAGGDTSALESASDGETSPTEENHQEQAELSGADVEDIKQALEQTLDKKLAPIMRMLARMQDRGPSVTEIFGGVGYIVGLVGLAAYLHYRRKIAQRREQ
jgi:nickel transport protein